MVRDMSNNAELIFEGPDYIHSSNTIFNFMQRAEFLEMAISQKRLAPRYCEEDIKYLNLMNGEKQVTTMAVLQKCFCDIPLHRIVERFPLSVEKEKSDSDIDDAILKKITESTHTDFYGKYGIAFSKRWAQTKNLQPVQYINEKSTAAKQFKDSFEFILNQEDVDDIVVSDVVLRMAYFKPLYGEMTRTLEGKKICVIKNFYDECEWRFIPKEEDLEKHKFSSILYTKELIESSKEISDRIDDEKYKELWLDFEFQDIRYLIVPDNAARVKLIDFIMTTNFGGTVDNQDKYLLISKILVLEHIKKDF